MSCGHTIKANLLAKNKNVFDDDMSIIASAQIRHPINLSNLTSVYLKKKPHILFKCLAQLIRMRMSFKNALEKLFFYVT